MDITEKNAIFMLIILFIINSMFLVMIELPANQDMTQNLSFGKSLDGVKNDMNGYFNYSDSIGDAIGDSNTNIVVGTEDKAVTALDWIYDMATGVSTAISGLLDSFGLVGKLLKMLGYIIGGYIVWIDYFFSPFAFLSGIALGLKLIFTILVLYGVVMLVLTIVNAIRR